MKYFKLSEFACPCCKVTDVKTELIARLDKARSIAGVPFIITSGYRCPKHNKKVGGVPNSAHVRGYAADIATTDSTRDLILAACRAAFTRIGVDEKRNFIHVDCDPDKKPGEWKY